VVAGQTVFLTYGMNFHSGQRIESSALKNIRTLQLVKINFQSVSFVTINHCSYTALTVRPSKTGKTSKSLGGSPLLSCQNTLPHCKLSLLTTLACRGLNQTFYRNLFLAHVCLQIRETYCCLWLIAM